MCNMANAFIFYIVNTVMFIIVCKALQCVIL